MQKYIDEERAAQEAKDRLKQGMAQRKAETAAKLKSEEEERMRKYIENERFAEDNKSKLKANIEATKKAKEEEKKKKKMLS